MSRIRPDKTIHTFILHSFSNPSTNLELVCAMTAGERSDSLGCLRFLPRLRASCMYFYREIDMLVSVSFCVSVYIQKTGTSCQKLALHWIISRLLFPSEGNLSPRVEILLENRYNNHTEHNHTAITVNCDYEYLSICPSIHISSPQYILYPSLYVYSTCISIYLHIYPSIYKSMHNTKVFKCERCDEACLKSLSKRFKSSLLNCGSMRV